MSRFLEQEYIAILKVLYIHDSRMEALSSHLLHRVLSEMERTGEVKSLEKWARSWKKCRLNIKKTYHKYNLMHSSDKKEIERLFLLYLDDKKVAKLLSDTSPHVLKLITDMMYPKPVKLIVKHPPRGFAERIASRLSKKFEQIAQKQGRVWVHSKE